MSSYRRKGYGLIGNIVECKGYHALQVQVDPAGLIGNIVECKVNRGALEFSNAVEINRKHSGM